MNKLLAPEIEARYKLTNKLGIKQVLELAAEFYYIRNMYMDTAKHLYDISVLFSYYKIQKLLNDKDELNELIDYKWQEEKYELVV